MNFYIISGMSGSGKSRAMATLEDLGYYCVDNMPVALIPAFAEICMAATGGKYERVALAVDVRAGKDIVHLQAACDRIKDIGCEYKIIYLDTATPILINRYKATRRKHPLMVDGVTMVDAIERERELLSSVRMRADFVVDTTRLEVSQLRETIISLVTGKKKAVCCASMSFRSALSTAYRRMQISCLMCVFCRIRTMKSACAKRQDRTRASEITCSATARRIGIWIICSRCLTS